MNHFFEKKNFLKEREFNMVKNEIKRLDDKFIPQYYDETELYRINMDTEFDSNRNSSAILGIFSSKLYDPDFRKEVASNKHDLAFKLFDVEHRFVTSVTQMREESDYRWHEDHLIGNTKWTGTFLSWIYYVNDDFEGGILEVKSIDDKILTIKPEPNKLILLPAHHTHRITKPIYNEKSNYRTTVNGLMFFPICN